MNISRTVLIALAAVTFSAFAARPASAASPWQLCLSLDSAGSGATHIYLLNLVTQGNGILVTGTYGHEGQDSHGTVTGTLSKTSGIPGPVSVEIGVTVLIANAGDFAEANTENVLFTFVPNGIVYKRWLNSNKPFTTGQAFVFTCPAA